MNKYDKLYIDFCMRISELSYAVRLKVGAIIVKDNNIIAYGYNGTPAGFENTCETECESGVLVTKNEVIHAEVNAVSKAARQGLATDGSTLYCNISPCIECAKLIIQSGIKKVVYKDDYRDNAGIALLNKANIEVIKWEHI